MSLPNLEQSGWEPGMNWVPENPEQQLELEAHYSTLRVHDRLRRYSERSGEPYEPSNWEDSVEGMLGLLQARESYEARPLPDVVRDTLTLVDQIKIEDNSSNALHALVREASNMLTRVGGHENEKTEVNPELLNTVVRWAAITHVSYHAERGWRAGITEDTCLETIKRTGLALDEIEGLLKQPKDAEAERLLNEDEYMPVYEANQRVYETQMVKQAKDIGFEFGIVHPYAAHLQSWDL